VPRPRTLYDKIWDAHVVEGGVDDGGSGTALLYIDFHLLDEHSSPQAFEGLRTSGRRVRRPQASLATIDHNAPTASRRLDGLDAGSRLLIETLTRDATEFGVPFFGLADPRQGITHVVGAEQGAVLPGMVVACGDSHVTTHGALGALGLGVGGSGVEHVLASQTLLVRRARNMRVTVEGELSAPLSPKDLILALIGRFGASGAAGHVVEFAGPVIRALSLEGRMTVSNMAVELGAVSGLIAPDDKTFAWLEGRPRAPAGADAAKARNYWRGLASDDGAIFDREATFDAAHLAPQITWGTNPQDVTGIDGRVPDPADEPDPARRRTVQRSLDYMGLQAGAPISGISVDRIFIGSCTNGRLEDLREAARIARKGRVASNVRALVVPGSGLVKRAAEQEGLDRIFRDAGFDWREPGCSMCLAMNPDRLAPGERCASTSSRNFEGRQGPGGRTHLMSPAMAAAAAIAGRIVDVRGV
jgi:3-isopropylmalate/(R)-2-methylmalate dehydratase large subunit